MKKFILIISLIISSNLVAQTTNYPQISIWEISNDTLDLGETFYIGVKYVSAVSTFGVTVGRVYIKNNTTINLVELYAGTISDLKALPKYQYSPTDSLIKITMKIPDNCDIGESLMNDNHPSSLDIPVFIQSTVGISENEINKVIKEIQYFNYLGQKVDKNESGLIIVVKTFTDNTQSIKKVFTINGL